MRTDIGLSKHGQTGTGTTGSARDAFSRVLRRRAVRPATVWPALALAMASVAAVALAATGPAQAEAIHRAVVTVNNDVVTEYDVNQRARLIALSTRQSGGARTRDMAIEQLVDEVLMKQEARRLKISVRVEDVQKRIAEFAGKNNLSVPQFTQALRAQNIDISTFSRSIEAQMLAQALWPEVVRSIYGREAQVRPDDVERELARQGGPKISTRYEFTSRTITFVIPPKASSTDVQRRQNEADRIRRSFQSCETARSLVTGLRDVVVSDLSHQTSDSLGPEALKLLESTAENRATPPRRTSDGIQITAICSKTEIEDDKTARRNAEIKLLNEKFGDLARRHLEDLRRDARIEGNLPARLR